MSEADYLFKISNEGLMERFKFSSKKFNDKEKQFYIERLIDELKIINKMGFSGYFLIVYDFIKWAKDNLIPVGPGRGSGCRIYCCLVFKNNGFGPNKMGVVI